MGSCIHVKVLLLLTLSNFKAIANEQSVSWAEIQALQNKITQLKQHLNMQHKSPTTVQTAILEKQRSQQPTQDHTILFSYATIRPTFGVQNKHAGSHWYVRDSLSYVGFKAIHPFAKKWSAQLHGEWRFDTANNNSIVSARRAYTAITSPFGRVAIGKQRSIAYQFIADYIEMFNYSSNPLTYPPDTDFFIDNLLTYRYQQEPFTLIAGAKFNGAGNDNQSDLVNIGVSYDNNDLHTGISFLSKEHYSKAQWLGQDNVWVGTFVYKFNPRLYGALFYQAKHYQRYLETTDRNGFTLDLSLSYQLAKQYKLKTRAIAFDNDFPYSDIRNQAYTGYALTLEWQPSPPLRVHIEYLNKDFDNQPDINALAVGLRYDFRHRLEVK
ncbi:hypothetical protein PA25_38030 [Pseudoalteromonas sp. A25]|nr:hypothetical protein PA25_38030 [Pseudoalteromonas sp. A25]